MSSAAQARPIGTLSPAGRRDPSSVDPEAVGGGFNSQVLSAVAGALNLSTTSLTADLQAGQSVPQIAAAQNVSMTTVNSAYLSAAQQEFNTCRQRPHYTGPGEPAL